MDINQILELFAMIMSIIIIHYIADFIFQDEKWALGKSKNFLPLLAHTMTYTAVWFVFGVMFASFTSITILEVFVFSFITFVAHTITDYISSKEVSKLFAANKLGSSVPNFGAFSAIGLDQVLHYIQLFLTYLLVVEWQ